MPQSLNSKHLYIFDWSLLLIARYSFVLKQRRMNEITQASKCHYNDSNPDDHDFSRESEVLHINTSTHKTLCFFGCVFYHVCISQVNNVTHFGDTHFGNISYLAVFINVAKCRFAKYAQCQLRTRFVR